MPGLSTPFPAMLSEFVPAVATCCLRLSHPVCYICQLAVRAYVPTGIWQCKPHAESVGARCLSERVQKVYLLVMLHSAACVTMYQLKHVQRSACTAWHAFKGLSCCQWELGVSWASCVCVVCISTRPLCGWPALMRLSCLCIIVTAWLLHTQQRCLIMNMHYYQVCCQLNLDWQRFCNLTAVTMWAAVFGLCGVTCYVV